MSSNYERIKHTKDLKEFRFAADRSIEMDEMEWHRRQSWWIIGYHLSSVSWDWYLCTDLVREVVRSRLQVSGQGHQNWLAADAVNSCNNKTVKPLKYSIILCLPNVVMVSVTGQRIVPLCVCHFCLIIYKTERTQICFCFLHLQQEDRLWDKALSHIGFLLPNCIIFFIQMSWAWR